jgi:hypothetical protein
VSLLAATGGYSGTMALAFLAAVLVVSPFAYRLVRRTLELQNPAGPAPHPEDESEGPNEDSEDPDGLDQDAATPISEVLETIDDLGQGQADSPRIQIEVPTRLSHEDRPLPPNLAHQILLDALGQAGWQLADREPIDARSELWTCVGRPG